MSDIERTNESDATPTDRAVQATETDDVSAQTRHAADDRGENTSRRAAPALAILGTVALLGAIALPGERSLLLSLAGTGLFGAVLARYLVPGRRTGPEFGDSVYAAFAATGQSLVSEFDLSGERVYVPSSSGADDGMAVRLFVPARPDYVVPSAEDLASVVVDGEGERARGIAVPASGAGLHGEFRDALGTDVATHPTRLSDQLTDALVNQFELVDVASADAESGRVTVSVRGSACGSLDRFDHPVPSFLAVGFASALDEPVEVDVTRREGSTGYAVTCTWSGGDYWTEEVT